ncbi:hypothetical protein CBR_g8546 [Chara braunii]|uniref:Prenylcysteine lyase domain-containing protein n=1 Tax=Chara braunii TaxID=69332 RepID=A0A388KMS6_CHABU|nr:hypothetical protein CBR_g8546 [Chara braunii]|eukprot:GBG71243.1 hypothetical protein CBR_g8546 [Chara braunii]
MLFHRPASRLADLLEQQLVTWIFATVCDFLASRSYLIAVRGLVEQFESFYDEDLPAFTRVEDLLQHAKLYDLTQKQLKDVLEQANISPLLMDELLTAIVRINYGQSLTISGLAGAIGLCGSGADLWAVDGGNRQVPEGLLRKAGAIVHLGEGVEIVRRVEGGKYDVITRHGDSEQFDVVVIATPLDEGALQLEPPIALPARKLQHTHTTFVVGCVDHKFFNLSRESDLPDTIATMENPTIPFSSIGLLMRFENGDGAFKVFSRQRPSEELLDKMFRRRLETIRIDWAAYPLYKTPEEFAPFLLDDHHLYYVNAFENAASTVETMAVAAKNVAKLIVKRLSDRTQHRHNVASTMDLSSDSSYELKSEL